jgi:hypothetical protein
MEYQVAVISHARAKNVQKIQQYAPEAIWYVGYGEEQNYLDAGAQKVIEAGNLIDSRNRALDDAHTQNKACVEISDDLGGLQIYEPTGLRTVTLHEVVTLMEKIATKIGAKLAGVAPTANTFYVNLEQPIKTQHFILGDLIWVAPSTPRFDTALKLKEDYDFTAQHITTYGLVARIDPIIAKFAHRTNAGGAVEYRTVEKEQEAIAILKAKWGNAIVDNPRRPNEILFKGKNLIPR